MWILRGLAFSLLIHFILYWILPYFETPEPELFRSRNNMVEFLDRATPEERKAAQKDLKEDLQFTRAVQLPKEVVTESDQRARFRSEDDIRVVKEQRAAKMGLNQNRAVDGSPYPRLPSEQQRIVDVKKNELKPHGKNRALNEFRPRPLSESILKGDLRLGGLSPETESKETVGGKSLQFPRLSQSDFERGVSTSGEGLPTDIAVGDFTALNTDRFLYYSFFARVQESVRYHWEGPAMRALQFHVTTHRTSGHETWETYIEVLLDRGGNFIRAILHDSSGVPSFDHAAVNAFRGAQLFPNPPGEMVKEDGYIHLHYRFQYQNSTRVAWSKKSSADF